MMVIAGEASITNNLNNCLIKKAEMRALENKINDFIMRNNILSAFPIVQISCDDQGFVSLGQAFSAMFPDPSCGSTEN